MAWRAVGNKIIVRKIEPKETVTGSGIILSESASTVMDKTAKAVVVSVGNGRNEQGDVEHLDVKEGDVILYHKNYGTDLGTMLSTEDEKELMVLHFQDVVAVITGE